MTVRSWIILTPAEAAAAAALATDEVRVEAREIDHPSANGLGHGVLTGRFVAPARLLADPDYAAWRPLLAGLPVAELDAAALFAPDDVD